MYGVEWTGIEKRSNFKLTSENQFLHWNSLVCAEWMNFVLLKCILAQSKQQSPKSEHSSSHLQTLDLKKKRQRYDKNKTRQRATYNNNFFSFLLYNLFHNQEFDEVTTRDECASIQNLQHSKNGIDIEFR